MADQSVLHSTFVVEKSYPVSPERVFAAFADPEKKKRWFGEGEGRGLKSFEMDFRVGGRQTAQILFTSESPVKGMTCVNDTWYEDIETNRRIVMAYTMTIGGRRISASQATFELLPTEKGTDLIFTEQGAFFEGSDGPQIRQQGWNTLLEKLGKELASA